MRKNVEGSGTPVAANSPNWLVMLLIVTVLPIGVAAAMLKDSANAICVTEPVRLTVLLVPETHPENVHEYTAVVVPL